MKHLFTLALLTITLNTSLHSALQKPAAPAALECDYSIDWRTAFHMHPLAFDILPRIPISKKNKPQIYVEYFQFRESLSLEHIIDTLITCAAINTPEDLMLFCSSSQIQLPDEQIKVYTERLRHLNILEAQLFQAIINPDHATVKKLLEQGARVNAQDSNDHTPVICGLYACTDSHVMALLLDQPNIDLSIRSGKNLTALEIAQGHDPLLNTLIKERLKNERRIREMHLKKLLPCVVNG